MKNDKLKLKENEYVCLAVSHFKGSQTWQLNELGYVAQVLWAMAEKQHSDNKVLFHRRAERCGDTCPPPSIYRCKK